jgi:hypothetical protein
MKRTTSQPVKWKKFRWLINMKLKALWLLLAYTGISHG